MSTILVDGKLTQAEALGALRHAAQSATDSLISALAKCKTEQDKQKVMGERDTILLTYLTSLQKSLIYTGPLFEKTALDLEKAADDTVKKAKNLKNTAEAINLFAGLLQLAATLALAFA